MRTIKAPGIQVNEIDKSNNDPTSYLGKTVLVPGFATKGDDYTPKYIYSSKDFIDSYGYPETLAEKYFYNAAKEIFNNGQIMLGVKLPYDNKSLNNFVYTSYKVEENISYLSSPSDIFLKNYVSYSNDYTTLSNLFFLNSFSENEREQLKEYLSSISFISDFSSWLSSHATIDFSLLSTFDLLFNNVDCFINLKQIFENYKDVDYKEETSDIRYITNKDLEEAILDKIPSSTNEIPTLNTTRNSYFNFSNAFKSLMNIKEEDSEISGKQEEFDENIKRIYEKFIFSGLSGYNYIKDQFIKEFSLKDVERYYNDFKNIYENNLSNVSSDIENILEKYLPEYSSISGDFKLDFTSIKETFPEIKTYRKINSFKRFNKKSGLITMDELDQLLIGMTELNLEKNIIKIIDKTRSKYNRDKTMNDTKDGTNQYLGIVPVITTAINALYFQNILRSKDNFAPYNIISEINTVDSMNPLNNMLPSIGSNYSIPLASDDSTVETIGSIAAGYFPKISWKDDNKVDTTYFNQIGVVVFKMLIDTSSYNKILLSPVESYIGSFDRQARDMINGTSIFIDDIINNNSQYIYFFSNVEKKDNCDTFLISNQTSTSLGFFASDYEKIISAKKSILDGLDIMFQKLSDTNRINIDLIVDAGMSDICQYIGTSCRDQIGKYEPTSDVISPYYQINANSLTYWRSIINKYNTFCKDIRKDCMFICDAPRSLSLEGNLPLIRKTKPQNTVENTILPKAKYLTGLNTSYGAGYTTWFSIIDDISYSMIWIPGTIKVMRSYLRFNDWEAPAGLVRGKILNAYDVSFNLTNKEAETFYTNNWNYAVSYPLDGIVIEGQKTFQKDRTAFDRVNVRRTFLFIEKEIKYISREILYEEITEYNLSSLREKIQIYLEGVKNSNAIVDFTVICDGRNNNLTTMENNEVHIAIGIKPTKVAEFIILNFVCTTQGADIEEITSGSI